VSVHTEPPKPQVAREGRADVVTAAAAIGLVAVAAVVGGVLYLSGRPVHAGAAPIFAGWGPHLGPGTPFALLVAALVVWRGPALARTMSWPRLLAAGYTAAVAWILALAMVDGWQRGLAGRLTTRYEYLSEVGGVTDVGGMLRGFAGRILDFQPDSWATHVSGHPPGALLVFVGLDRIGLGGGAWAAIVCVLVGALVVVAVPVTLRALGDEPAARTAVPFLVLFPGAVWIGASADGLFAGVTAAGVALLAVGLTRRRSITGPLACVLAGVLLGYGIYLSYGLVLMAPIVVAVAVLAGRVVPLLWSVAGAAAVVVAFTAAGFWWVDGYHLVVERYYQGIATDRPYAYWVWANIAAAVVCAGPTAAVVLRRAAAGGGRWLIAAARTARRSTAPDGTGAEKRRVPPMLATSVLLPVAAGVAILAADLSGLSKAEVERIWLPFVVWLMAGAALLPALHRRRWLVAQAAVALLVNHLLLTSW
jgi:hypothetical protein